MPKDGKCSSAFLVPSNIRCEDGKIDLFTNWTVFNLETRM